ncbi:TPA: NAD-dependent epimerase/dehydratase family protein, partial [Escherichia coli]
MKYTVIGGSGFIGSAMCNYLKNNNKNVFIPERDYHFSAGEDLGIVFYCAGYGDCINNYDNVIDANVLLLRKILNNVKFKKLVYVSSTRVYMNENCAKENADLLICHNDNRKLFNLMKLAAEEICRLSKRNVIIVRPSNVYGLALNSKLFLPQIIKNAILNNKIDMYVAPEYSKDYVSVDDLVHIMFELAHKEFNDVQTFNIASGVNTSAAQIADIIKRKTNCEVIWHDVNIQEKFPVTDITKINELVAHNYRDVISDLSKMID